MKLFLKKILIGLIVTSLMSVAGISIVHAQISSKLSKAKRLDVKEVKENNPGEPTNILLVGSDTRENIDQEETDKFGSVSQAGGGQRSDTMMILRIDPKTKKSTVVSLPRDLWVDIPDYGNAKINAAYNSELGGGPNRLIQTIKENFDVDINHFIQVDFQSFREIVDILGTVEICFPAPARDKKTGLDVPNEGCHQLNGVQSLQYVRSRYYEQYVDGVWKTDISSDLGRIQRQQAFMKTLASQAIGKGFANLKLGNNIANSVLERLTIDEELSRNDIFSLVEAFQGVDVNNPDQVLFTTLPAENSFREKQSVLILKEDEASPIFKLLRGTSQKNDPIMSNLDPSQVKIQILNASGTSGLAGDTLQSLSKIGFLQGGTGNASSRKKTEIQYKAGKLEAAKLVKEYVDGDLVEVTSQSVDVIIVLGSNFDGVDTGK